MIIYRTWLKPVIKGNNGVRDWHYQYEGWFLFGFIPLYIRRYGQIRK